MHGEKSSTIRMLDEAGSQYVYLKMAAAPGEYTPDAAAVLETLQ